MARSMIQIRPRYLMALGAIAVVAVCAQDIVQRALRAREAHASVINAAGRQRMLSQRLAKCALALSHVEDPRQGTRARELASALSAFSHGHEALRRHEMNSPSIVQRYRSLDRSFDGLTSAVHRVLANVAEGTPVVTADVRAVLAHESTFLPRMDAVVGAYEEISERSLATLMRHELWLMAITLIVLLIEALFVFEPMRRALMTKIDALRAAEREARAAARVKDDFLATISHELRTPLNGILGSNALLGDTSLTEAQAELVAAGEASGAELMHLIDDILDYVRANAGEMIPDTAPVAIAPLLTRVVERTRALASDSIAVSSDVAKALPATVLADERRLEQILTKLGENAAKFTCEGSIRFRAAERNGRLAIAVDDTGIGIPAGEEERVFEAFAQAESASRRSFGGAGLGLAVSRAIARSMAGDLRVEPTAAPGSRFVLEVPLVRCAASEAQSSDGPTARTHAPTFRQHVTGTPVPGDDDATDRAVVRPGLHVLAVEDNKVNQRMLVHHLEHAKAKYAVAENGIEAVALAERTAFDVILMDCQMPEMDGFEATRRIRKLSGHADTPIIALTANTSDTDRRRCREAGMNDHIGKPYRRDVLLDRLATWTTRAPSAPRSGSSTP